MQSYQQFVEKIYNTLKSNAQSQYNYAVADHEIEDAICTATNSNNFLREAYEKWTDFDEIILYIEISYPIETTARMYTSRTLN